jgi:hypothetical protein
MSAKQRPLWKCPKCGAQFVTANIWHSCGRYTAKDLFAKSEPNVCAIYRKLARMIRKCGPVRIIPQKTRLVFTTRVRFVAVYPRKSFLEIGIELPERDPHPRFHKVESYTIRMHGHYLRVENESQLDDRVQSWLRKSYLVGLQHAPTKKTTRAAPPPAHPRTHRSPYSA